VLPVRSSPYRFPGFAVWRQIYVDLWPGYVGGSALAHLIQHSERVGYEITTLLRSAEKAKAFGKMGFKTVLGSLDDVADLEKFAVEIDIVFQTVSTLTPVTY